VKNETFTDHPAYQEPINRSRAIITLRKIAGVLVILLLSTPFVVGGGLGVLYASYEIVLFFIQESFEQLALLQKVVQILATIINVLLGVEFFRWGRHLTRPTSREFV